MALLLQPRNATSAAAVEHEARMLQGISHPMFPTAVGWMAAPGDAHRRLIMTCAEGGDLFDVNRCSFALTAQPTPARQPLHHLPPARHSCMCACACLLTPA